uniref:DNA-directed RNA polymerase III subunit RPC10 n=6 Tax=Aves TaxID=8782 RepID=A0A8B9IH97_ANSCY
MQLSSARDVSHLREALLPPCNPFWRTWLSRGTEVQANPSPCSCFEYSLTLTRLIQPPQTPEATRSLTLSASFCHLPVSLRRRLGGTSSICTSWGEKGVKREPRGATGAGPGSPAAGRRSPAEVLGAALPGLPQLDVPPQRLLQLQHGRVLHHHHGCGGESPRQRPLGRRPRPTRPPPLSPRRTHGLAVRLADAHRHGLPVLQRHLRADLLRRHLRGRSQSSGSCTSRASAAWKSSSTSACASSSSGSAIAGPEGAARGAEPAMLLFCPACGNVLVAEEGPRCHRFACTTCPYVRNVTRKVTSRKYPQLKEVDDVLGGAAAWENVDSTAEPCPKCEHPRAYFMQIQTRSADEPMTTFYKCCSPQCGHRWRD